MKSIEKYLPDARRIVRFEFFNYEGPENIPTYEVYCDDIMIACSSIRNQPELYDDKRFYIDCIKTISDQMIRLMKVNPVIGISDMGVEIQTLINKDLAHGFFKDLDYIMGKTLQNWNDGVDFKKDKIAYKKLIQTMKMLYEETYNKTAPKYIANKLLEMVSEESELASEFRRSDDSPLNGEVLEAYITYYSKDRDKNFYKTIEKYIHEEALKKFGELSEGYEASATNLLYLIQQKLNEQRTIRKIQEWMSPDENFYIEK